MAPNKMSAWELIPSADRLAFRPLSARARVFGALAIATAALAGCAAPWAGMPPAPLTKTGEYHLGPGDKIRVITFGNEQLTGEFRVSASGDIEMPLLGAVHVAGLTPRQLGHRLASELAASGMLKSPSVSVEVAAYRPIFILGEVKKPGEYPYEPGMSVLTAVAIAGGFTYRAIESEFSIVREENGAAKEYRANRETLLQPGDVIDVYERHF